MKDVHRLLLVEDDELLREVFLMLLRDLVQEIVVAETGTEALALLEGQKFDAVITDVRMPGASGLEVMRKAKQVSVDTRVIVMSGYADEDTQREVEAGGAVLVHKPFGAAELQRALEASASDEGDQTGARTTGQ